MYDGRDIPGEKELRMYYDDLLFPCDHFPYRLNKFRKTSFLQHLFYFINLIGLYAEKESTIGLWVRQKCKSFHHIDTFFKLCLITITTPVTRCSIRENALGDVIFHSFSHSYLFIVQSSRQT